MGYMSYDNKCKITYMGHESQADAVRQVEEALLALRLGAGRGYKTRERARELQALDEEFRDVMDENQGSEGER